MDAIPNVILSNRNIAHPQVWKDIFPRLSILWRVKLTSIPLDSVEYISPVGGYSFSFVDIFRLLDLE